MLRSLVIASAAILIQSLAVLGQTSAESTAAPSVPPELQVPAGNVAYLKGHAVGTQNYMCLPATTGFGWRFVAPQATLFFTYKLFNIDIRQQIITHFLSPNPDENGTARATWQSSVDTSAVWGKAIATSSAPPLVAAGAIPWLLLEVVGRERGPMGGAILTGTTFIHRINTAGGVMPASGCSEASDVGKLSLVPYSADYFFYRPANSR